MRSHQAGKLIMNMRVDACVEAGIIGVDAEDIGVIHPKRPNLHCDFCFIESRSWVKCLVPICFPI